MKIAITGVTGLVGSNLLFEIIKQNIRSLDDLEIFVFGRNADNATLQQRVQKIIRQDGVLYMGIDESETGKIEDYCKNGIKYIETDIEKKGLGIKKEDLRHLQSKKIDFFFHIAASTDLRHNPGIEKLLRKTNVIGTQKILELISTLKLGEFCYVGTAYSCGVCSGEVRPDVVELNRKFRNAYERSKLEAEILVRDFSRKNRLKCRYFRPSVTCGRLIENPLGSINKFDVFYKWGAFFLQIKTKLVKNTKDLYGVPVTLDVRTCYNAKAGLNIVPVDYVAKVMYQVCVQNDPNESYHLVNSEETPHEDYIGIMLKSLKVDGVKHVPNIPVKQNKMEKIYYKTTGSIFTPYISGPSMKFNTSNLDRVLNNSKIQCPPVDKKTFPILMEYALKHDFGIDIQGRF